MEEKRWKTMQQVQEDIARYREMFTQVRLLDGQTLQEETAAKEAEKQARGESICPDCRDGCKNCIAEKALREKAKKTKLEYMNDDMFQITARYLEIEGKPYVLEAFQHLDVEEVEEEERLVSSLSSYRDALYLDALTAVYNRRYYEDKFRNMVCPAGVALIDLDDFKVCNDTFGHQAGDAALIAAVDVARHNIRKTDSLIRYGGDEFLLIMPEITEQAMYERLRTICSQVYKMAIPEYPYMQLSVSIGGVLTNGNTIEEAVRRADRLMYRAKNRKNMVVTERQEVEDSLWYGEKEAVKQKILLVDDSEMNRALLSDMLQKDYEVLEACNGKEALEMLKEYGTGIALVLLDIIMPEMDGFGVLSVMNRENLIDDIPVVVISSADSDEVIQRAYDLGAADYISRPFDARLVYRRVFNTITLYTKQRRLLSLLTAQINEREKNSHMMVNILSHTVELHNGESGRHILHVRRLTERILEWIAQKTDRYVLTASDRERIATASALHDIGKIAIDDKIINKPGKLTPAEFEQMKKHTVIGADLLNRIEEYRDEPFIRTAYQICRWHHERYDGKGYPDGLKGDEIPIAAQVVSLADVYDALVSDRVYKKAIPAEKAVQMILQGECGAFNPMLLECLRDQAENFALLEQEIEEA